MSKTIRVQLERRDALCYVPVPFDPKAVFGKVRAPVTVTLNGYTFRSTISTMGGVTCIPLRRSHREAAGLDGDETLAITIALDTAPRDVEVPDDLRLALEANPTARERWPALSFTHKREYVEAVEGAKKPETRARRIASTVEALSRGKR